MDFDTKVNLAKQSSCRTRSRGRRTLFKNLPPNLGSRPAYCARISSLPPLGPAKLRPGEDGGSAEEGKRSRGSALRLPQSRFSLIRRVPTLAGRRRSKWISVPDVRVDPCPCVFDRPLHRSQRRRPVSIARIPRTTGRRKNEEKRCCSPCRRLFFCFSSRKSSDLSLREPSVFSSSRFPRVKGARHRCRFQTGSFADSDSSRRMHPAESRPAVEWRQSSRFFLPADASPPASASCIDKAAAAQSMSRCIPKRRARSARESRPAVCLSPPTSCI